MPVRLAEDTLRAVFDRSIPNVQTGCLVWQGGLNRKGYGVISLRGKYRGTHRVVYELAVGSIPNGLHVLHRCDNRRCVNKEHLFLGTNRDNIDDKIEKDRSGKKLDIEKAKRIKTMLLRGLPHRVIADEFGISPTTVSYIKSGRHWAHVQHNGGTVAKASVK